MADYRISNRADGDLFDIYVHGVERFGRVQAISYQMSFRDCFELLAEHPRMGRLSPSIAEDVRRHEHGSHVILYQEREDHVLIVAVLHGRSLHGLKV